MNACVAAGRREQATELLPKLRQHDSSAVQAGHNVLLKACLRAGDLDAARASFASMCTADIADQTSANTLALGLFRAGRLSEVKPQAR